MNQSPIPKALSTIFGSRVRALLMGGQACILYGAAEFSRDIDLAIPASADNLNHLRTVLDQLQAETTYVPDLSREVLVRGHACHFRCGAPGVEGLRIDVMGKLRGLPNFDVLWNRRTEIVLPEVSAVPVIALEDLVRAKKTQRDKDWPMIRRLIEADYYQRHSTASEENVRFWLAECRTPDILQEIVSKYPGLARDLVGSRPLLRSVLVGRHTDTEGLLRDEEDRERSLDRRYWAPLRSRLKIPSGLRTAAKAPVGVGQTRPYRQIWANFPALTATFSLVLGNSPVILKRLLREELAAWRRRRG